jgi:site-specific recombinase XerD
MRARSAVVAVAGGPAARVDWRHERMVGLVEQVPLGDEWDADRLIVMPHPGGLLATGSLCQAPDCPNLAHRGGPLCQSHQRSFAGSAHIDLGGWLASGQSGVTRPRFMEERCVVVSAEGDRCARPGEGRLQLCKTHAMQWTNRRRAGDDWSSFLARARPGDDLGGCVAASCYLAACYKQSRLCDAHYAAWRAAGFPAGDRLQRFLARAPQPTNRRILSLRGLPELVRLELLYAIGCRVHEQVQTRTTEMRPYVDRLLASGVASLTDFDPEQLGGHRERRRFARFAYDRVRLAYADQEAERDGDVWDLRVFGRSGRLDFSGIRQQWLRQASKAWASTAMVRLRSTNMLQHRVQAVAAMSRVLATCPGGGEDPARLGRGDVDRFLLRVASLPNPATGRPYTDRRVAQIVEDCACVLRELREMGLLADLGPTFVFRRGDYGRHTDEEEAGRALPGVVVAQLDARLDLLRGVPGSSARAGYGLGVLGDHAGEVAVLAYQLLKGTGRRLGEVVSLHLDCLDVDEHGGPVLIYDNHKRQRMGRRLPLADSELVEAVRAQQEWVIARFPAAGRDKLWLFPRANKNAGGSAHMGATQLFKWLHTWVARIPRLDAGTFDNSGDPVPFDRSAIHPHAFRHTYAQTLADQGVAAPVLRDLMDHQSIDTTLGYYRVGEAKSAPPWSFWLVSPLTTGAPPAASRLRCREPLSYARSCPGWRCPWAAAPSPPTCVPEVRPAPSATSAPAVPTSSPTPPTCRNCAATPTIYAESARRCSPQARPAGPSNTSLANST